MVNAEWHQTPRPSINSMLTVGVNSLNESSWESSDNRMVMYSFKRMDCPYPGTPSDLFKQILKKAGLRSTCLHGQRHLHATELLRIGEPLHVVANRLRHHDAMVMATIYAHVTSEQADTASTRFADASARAT